MNCNQPSIALAWRETPFTGALHRELVVREGGRWPTIGEIVVATKDLPARFQIAGEVRINGELIPRACWHLVRPKLSAQVPVGITLHFPLYGGDGGGGNSTKQTLALVATIVVFLAAAAVSGGALGFLGPAFLAGQIGATVAAATISVAGSLAIAALTPAPTLETPAAASNTGITDYSGKPVSLSGNVLAPGAAVPRVIGTHRIHPPLICEPLIEIVGEKEYGETVYALAGPHAITDVRVGNVPVDEIEEVVIEVQEGTQDSLIPSLVSRQGKTQGVNIELSRHIMAEGADQALLHPASPTDDLPQWHRIVTRNAPDEVWLTLTWPEGLFNELTPTNTWQQPLRVRLRARGDVSWIDLPEVHFSFNQPQPFTKMIVIKWVVSLLVLAVPPTARGPIYAYKQVPAQTASPAGSVWDAHSYFSAGAGNHLLSAATAATSNVRNVELLADRVVFWLDPATFPPDVYEIEVKLGQSVDPSIFTASTYVFGPNIKDLFGYFLSGGVASVAMRKGDVHDRAIVTRAASVWNENPVATAQDFATISVRVHSRTLEQLSCLASGYVLDWDGYEWGDLVATSNPAPHFRDVLAGTLAAEPLPADMIDDANLLEWRTHCNTELYTCDAVVDGRSGEDVLRMIAACGYARPRMSETWGVVVDKDRSAESPVQIFTPRNTSGFSFARAFNPRPTGLRARFNDADDDYRENALIVLDPDAAPDAATKLEEIRYDGLVLEVDVEARALFDLAQLSKRFVFYQATIPVEAMVCQRGDLIGFQHDVITEHAGFARVKDVVLSGANVVSLALDGTIPVKTKPGLFAIASLFIQPAVFDLGAKTGISIRLANQTSIIKEVTAADEETDHINFVTPFADPGSTVLRRDCLVTAGRLGFEYHRLLVLDVAPQADLAAQVTFVPEAPELWN
jgi:hypothetical protein